MTAYRAYWVESEQKLILLFPSEVEKEEGWELITSTFAGYPGSFRNNVAMWLEEHGKVPLTSNFPKGMREILAHQEHRRRYREQERKHATCRPGDCRCRLDPDYYGSEHHPKHIYFNGY